MLGFYWQFIWLKAGAAVCLPRNRSSTGLTQLCGCWTRADSGPGAYRDGSGTSGTYMPSHTSGVDELSLPHSPAARCGRGEDSRRQSAVAPRRPQAPEQHPSPSTSKPTCLPGHTFRCKVLASKDFAASHKRRLSHRDKTYTAPWKWRPSATHKI